MTAKKEKEEGEKVYTIPLKNVFKQPKTKRANKAIKTIKDFLSRHDGREIKLSNSIAKVIWSKGRETPPREIKVKVSGEEGKLKAGLAE